MMIMSSTGALSTRRAAIRSAFLLILVLLLHPAVAESWSSWFSSSSSSDDSASKEEQNLDDLVSPIVNREVQASVVAHKWPTTPQSVLCEAFAYHIQQNTVATFLDRLVSLLEESEDDDTTTAQLLLQKSKLEDMEQATQLALAASTFLTGTAFTLLDFSLAMRAASPLCELHRSLARDSLPKDSLQQDFDLVAVSYPPGKVVLQADLLMQDWKSWAATVTENVTDEALYLPGEQALGEGNALVVLYANLGTLSFAHVYQMLLKVPSLRVLVRHLGAYRYEEDPTTATPTLLQGYGMRLDIRNVEYKVFDDRSGGDQDNQDHGLINLTAAAGVAATEEGDATDSASTTESTLQAPPGYLAGVNLKALGIDTAESLELLSNLWKRQNEQSLQEQMVPPLWQRRKLPLQASTVISSAPDPLATLQEVSQNLPTVVSTLVHVKTPKAILDAATQLEEARIPYVRPGRIWLNGNALSMEKSSLNIFEVLNVLRKEQAQLSTMEDQLSPYLDASQLRSVQRAWMQGDEFVRQAEYEDQAASGAAGKDDSFRVNVGTGWRNAIYYLNDIEKDAQYAEWTRSVRQMLMNLQFGMPPSVRRNLFTVLAVIDPITGDPANAGFNLGLQLMANQYPARVGVLLVNQNDIEMCQTWMATQKNIKDETPCPERSIFGHRKTKPSTIEELKEIPATTQAMHRLFFVFAKEYKNDPGAVSAYLEYMLKNLQDFKESQSDSISMYDLTLFHATLMEGMGLASLRNAHKEALNTLTQGPEFFDDLTYTYGRSIRFAVDKGILPEMSFLNGRILTVSNDDGDDGESSTNNIGLVFQEEQQHIFGMVMSGRITDHAPRSVYARLMAGKRVFTKFHPLLAGSAEVSSDDFLQHDFDSATSILPVVGSKEGDGDGKEVDTKTSTEATTFYLVEAVMELDSQAALQRAASVVSVVASFELDASQRIDFRLVPSTPVPNNSALCRILSHATKLQSLETLAAVLNKLGEQDETLSLEGLFALGDGLSDLQKVALLSIPEDDEAMPCSDLSSFLPNADWHGKSALVANGRVFALEGALPTKEDLGLLLTMERPRAKAVTQLLGTQTTTPTAVARVAQFLALSEATSTQTRTNVEGSIESALEQPTGHGGEVPSADWWKAEDNPLKFTFNQGDESEDGGEALKIIVTAVVDPITEAAQRMSPLLRILRDRFGLPTTVILMPATEIDDNPKLPITSYYRFVVGSPLHKVAKFSNLPTNHVLTLRTDVPEPWNVQQKFAIQDTDNLRCDVKKGCSDAPSTDELYDREDVTRVVYDLKDLLIFGQCYDTSSKPPNGLQLTLTKKKAPLESNVATVPSAETVEVNMDGTVSATPADDLEDTPHADTLVMKNVGYWQLHAGPGVWKLEIAKDSKGAEIFDIVPAEFRRGRLHLKKIQNDFDTKSKTLVLQDFVNQGELLPVKRRPGFEKASLFPKLTDSDSNTTNDDDVIHVFSLATGHLYERFLKIMMLSVTKRTSSKVKFWLFENFLSPSFKSSAQYMAQQIGSELEFVTYKWPEWLRGQREKQRIIWGYKILFLDVLFPLNVKKIIYVDADQVLRGDLKELWNLDLNGAPYGYTPMCSSRESTLGYQFWSSGFWKDHLRGKPYHISALYVVDLERFRKTQVGDALRAMYQQLSADPNSLANLDQDLPNYAQHSVKIFSLPQEWLWCESWCSDETKATAKTIDLCNNPRYKEPKVEMAKRIISGSLFPESWVELDAMVEQYDQEYQQSIAAAATA